MKTLIAAVSILIGASLLTASVALAESISEHEVPAPVTATFAAAHADISSVEWERVSGNYLARFNAGGSQQSMTISPPGKLIQTRTVIPPTDLPPAITAYCKEKLPDTDLLEAAKIIDISGKTRYEAILRGMSFVFDESGTALSRTVD